MEEIKDKSVDVIVTSPPYWDLKNYYKENQIGQSTYDVYSKEYIQYGNNVIINYQSTELSGLTLI